MGTRHGVSAPRFAPPVPRFEAPPPPEQRDPGRIGTRSTSGLSDVDAIMTDARERAERVIDESMARARELISRERGAPSSYGTVSGESIEPIRRSVDELLTNMRDVQSRLARIESMLASARAATPAPPPPTPAPPPPVQRPVFPPPEEERRPGVLSVVAPQQPAPRPMVAPPPAAPPVAQPPPPPPPVAPAVSIAPTAPPVPPTQEPPAAASSLPPSAVPPMRGGGQAAAAPMPEPEAQREPLPPEPAPSAAGWQRAEPGEPTDADTLATFTPADGSVLLRAAPVSGFQGLMRLQDALQRIPAVRQATVEAYSQGEARLRLEIASDIDSDEIADHVSAGLGQSAQVRGASEADRTIIIALG